MSLGKFYEAVESLETEHERVCAENFILQTNYGIIPFDMWEANCAENKYPFSSFSEKEAKRLKRKFRKLKKILSKRMNIPYSDIKIYSKKYNGSYMFNINRYLRERENF